MAIKRIIETNLRLTPEELAEEFWDMVAEDQAEFFNHLRSIAMELLPLQLQSVNGSEELTDGGRIAMSYIGEYAEKQK